MPEPRIKRYALVPKSDEDGVRRFSLARVPGANPSVPGAERLERMEEIAAMEHRGDDDRPVPGGPTG